MEHVGFIEYIRYTRKNSASIWECSLGIRNQKYRPVFFNIDGEEAYRAVIFLGARAGNAVMYRANSGSGEAKYTVTDVVKSSEFMRDRYRLSM